MSCLITYLARLIYKFALYFQQDSEEAKKIGLNLIYHKYLHYIKMRVACRTKAVG